ncbi:hypothetical protein [Microseira wollei]|uniref:Uncharacterized protein n=1 Tax=Microseira wollei NIES-4236 TaxID=2530354 RepID=A0AAV3WIV8_9CYAN|nr:hypothetical protein [Microseira wollei]GET39669.1 hypothetical protein MiSe_44400 [Microseira wollei NIES-4236]
MPPFREALANQLTEEVYAQMEEEFFEMGGDFLAFVANFSGEEREFRVKFLEEWDRRNKH